ncbi:MAG TPA: hypothetical protein VLS25_03180 [Dehalococcoidia bacterium]|nr:hypothetical protein [Dehalococcoidia bacterium]
MYTRALRVHAMQLAANLFWLVAGELILLVVRPFDGFGGDWADDNARWLRLGGALFALYVSVEVLINRSQRKIKRRIGLARRREWIDDPVGHALEATRMLSALLLGAIGACGLVIFLATGDRLDLYVFVVPTLALLAVSFPTRSRWDSDRVRYSSSTSVT